MPWAAYAAIAVTGALAIPVIYVLIRRTFLLIPVTVAEHRFGVGRARELSRGNVLRIVVLMVVMLICVLVVELVLLCVEGAIAFAMAGPALRSCGAELSDSWRMLGAGLQPVLPVLGIVALAAAPLLYGPATALSVFAYRALVPENPSGACWTRRH
jgi:hypothetical protein